MSTKAMLKVAKNPPHFLELERFLEKPFACRLLSVRVSGSGFRVVPRKKQKLCILSGATGTRQNIVKSRNSLRTLQNFEGLALSFPVLLFCSFPAHK